MRLPLPDSGQMHAGLTRFQDVAIVLLAAMVLIEPVRGIGPELTTFDIGRASAAKLIAISMLVSIALAHLGPERLRARARFGWLLRIGALILLSGAWIATADAAGSGMPWEEPLQQVLESVQGPVARIMAVIIIIITGLTLAFGETAGGFRRLIQIIFGLSIAFAASSFFLSFFSFGGGALIA